MLYFAVLALGLVLGGGTCYFILHPKTVQTRQLDEALQVYNQQLAEQNEELTKANAQKQQERNILELQIENLKQYSKEIERHNTQLSEQAKNTVDNIQAERMTAADQAYEYAAENFSREAEEWREQAIQDYTDVLSDCVAQFSAQLVDKQEQLKILQDTLNRYQSIVSAAVEERKRADEELHQRDYYKLVLSNQDLEEIRKLRSVIPYLHDGEPINKVIWKVYYEKPYTDLVGRVIGNGRHTGIYKITEIESGKCYVGQAADIADRWRQHIKRGIGAEAPTRNKLYPAMLAIGVENFTFEVIEECDRNVLDEREDFWQDYFKAKEYGYSIK